MTSADTPGPTMGLSSVLSNVEGELTALAERSEAVQDALSKTLAAMPLGERDLVVLQSLDIITQHLAGLSNFLRELSPQLTAAWIVDPASASRMIGLASLAHRLARGADAPVEDESDDCFFDDGPIATAA